MTDPKSTTVIVIGAGIAGLSTGVYAQLNGYKSRIYEMGTQPGGLMTAWKRKGYIIDGCIHWLTGSSPRSSFYKNWEEIGLIQDRQIFDPEVFIRVEGEHGEILNLYTDFDRLEKHLLELAPEDADLIREFIAAGRFICPLVVLRADTGKKGIARLFDAIKFLPKLLNILLFFRRWGRITMRQFGARFTNPFLRETFSKFFMEDISAIALLYTLAGLHEKTCGYPIGGSMPMAVAVEKRYLDLGGAIHYKSRVHKILVENDRAVGVQLEDGRQERADYVISAADGHATIFDMLEGRYVDKKIRKIYRQYRPFPPILLVGLGVQRTFPDMPGATGGTVIKLDKPIIVAGEQKHELECMIYNFDSSLSPDGKTVLTVMIETRYEYWKELGKDQARYEAEKEVIVDEVISCLDKRFPGFATQVEMVDVATPNTFERYTGNWQASFEGWLPTPDVMSKAIPKTLPGLHNFYMAGQWVQPGGGLPCGITTGRDVVSRMCKQDGIKFQ
jgi:phytoene dehydrogenase-like protein